MRGTDYRREGLFSYVRSDSRVPKDHPLRAIRRVTDAALGSLSALFDALYSNEGRPSIAPEKLLRALLLQAFYTVRSERQLMEQLDYNLLFRWFVGLSVDEPVWDPTVFSKNRDRLLEGETAAAFLSAVLNLPEVSALLSKEHFSVDGTLLQAWASMKSFRRKDGSDEPPAPGRNGERDFHQDKRSNETHASTTDPDARLVTPHVAQNIHARRGSNIDARTTRHGGYAVSQVIRKRIEEANGWIKCIGGMTQTRFRGLARVNWMFQLKAAAYNLIRLPKLPPAG
jgi:transposase